MATAVSHWAHLTGATITAESLPRQEGPGALTGNEYVRVTNVTGHPMRGTVIVELDGMITLWTSDDPDGVQVVTAQPSVFASAQQVARHDGPMSLHQAMRLIEDAHSKWRGVVQGVPANQLRARQVRTALAKAQPGLPPAQSSRYTSARIRRTAADRWVADLGHGGSLRPLGEHGTLEAAREAVQVARDEAWRSLRAWLTQYVAGSWTLAEKPLEITEEDRIPGPAVADLLGIASATWRGYVSRGQAPAADGHSGDGRPYWTMETLEAWDRPGQGARTDRRTSDKGDQQ